MTVVETHRPDEVCVRESPAPQHLELVLHPCAGDGGVVGVDGEVCPVPGEAEDGMPAACVGRGHGDCARQQGGARADLEVDPLLQAAGVDGRLVHRVVAVADSLGVKHVQGLRKK